VRGCISATAIAAYLSPSIVLGSLAYYAYSKGTTTLVVVGIEIAAAMAFVLAVFTLPGCMTVYAVEDDAAVLRNPANAFRRAWCRRRVYCRAWAIALASVTLSFAGALAAVIGFLYTSVWCWDVVGYAFTVAMYVPLEHTRNPR